MTEDAGRAHQGQTGPVTPQELISQGVYLFYREREREAIAYLRSALKEKPGDLRARYLICLAAQLHSDEKVIEQMCRAARRYDSQNPYALACEGVRFLDYSNYARADQYFEQALLKIPNDVDLWFGRGLVYECAGEREKALGAYLRVVTLDPANVAGRIALGRSYADVGEFETAFEQYARSKELAPDTDNPHFRLGRDLFFSGNPTGAIIEFRAAIAEEPMSLGAYFLLLSTLRHLGKSDETLEVYQEIRRVPGADPEITGGFFEQIGAWDDAIRDYSQALVRAPGNPELHSRLASCYHQAGRWDQAVAEFREVLRLDPDAVFVYEPLAETLFRAGRYREAEVVARRAIELDPHFYSAYPVLADCLILEGKTESAAQLLEQQQRLQQQAWAKYQAKYFGRREG
jgi:tetratricopeptide (TPR) repeat protein